ncbi:MAG: class I SAM-dependent RNA methyltransferase [Inquilinus sp.]|nr:class I SAM-dependent RNA methyltransferase [Inquilinus sp.]
MKTRRRTRSEQSGRIIETAILALGAQGDGIGDGDGRPLYVPLTLPGERVRVRLGERRGDGLAAELVEVLAPSPDRRPAPCGHFGVCGGCSVQHLGAAAYAAWKRDLVVAALARAGLAGMPVAPAIVTPPASRRRATLAARRLQAGVVLGFNERRRHRIVDLTGCPVLLPSLVALLPILRETLAALLAPGEAAEVSVAALDGGADVVLGLPGPPDLAAWERLAALAETAALARLSVRTGDGEPEPVAARRPATLILGGVPVAVPPGSFLQASAEGGAALTRLVRDGVGTAARVADLFCGVGTFALPLAGRAKVFAVDSARPALAALAAAAAGSGLDGRLRAEFRNLFRDPLAGAELSGFGAVVFDPPRAGAAAQAAALAASPVPVVVGVSCNPASFARDAAALVAGGYRLERVTPVDQFLWSAHVELVGVFRR